MMRGPVDSHLPEKRARRPAPLLLALGSLRVFTDRLIAHDGRVCAIGPDTTAKVGPIDDVDDSPGSDSPAKPVGGLLIPGGFFLLANESDERRHYHPIYVTIEDPSWSYVLGCHPDAAAEARQFATAVRRAATGIAEAQQRLEEPDSPPIGPSSSSTSGRAP